VEERRTERDRGALRRGRALPVSLLRRAHRRPCRHRNSWLDDPDEPGSFDASYECFAADGDAAVAIGTSTYFDGHGEVDRVYDNVFVLRFDAVGRCSDFTEWYVKRP
jgi:hypothetical protein